MAVVSGDVPTRVGIVMMESVSDLVGVHRSLARALPKVLKKRNFPFENSWIWPWM